MNQRELLKQFAKSPFIVRLKLWTPRRSIMELEGGVSKKAGEIVISLLCTAKFQPKAQRLIDELHAELYPDKQADG